MLESVQQGTDQTEKSREASRVAKDFESVFASMMLKEMRKTLEPGGMFGEDSNDVYGGLFDQYLGQQMSEGGGFGLARMVRESLVREQAAVGRQPGFMSRSSMVPEVE